MKKILLIIFVLLFPGVIWADTPPSWQLFTIESDNGKYIAELVVESKKSKLKPWENKYRLKVSAKDTKTELWTCLYNYNGYPDGILSNDGTTFVYVNDWYHENGPVVNIYYQGLKQHDINGNDFWIDSTNLVNTASHKLWLIQHKEPKYRFSEVQKRLVLEINTIDDNHFLINVESGHFVY